MTEYKVTLPEDISKEEFFNFLWDLSDGPNEASTRVETWNLILTTGANTKEAYDIIQGKLYIYCEKIRENRV